MRKILSLIIISFFFSGNVNSAPQDGKGELKLSYNAAKDNLCIILEVALVKMQKHLITNQ